MTRPGLITPRVIMQVLGNSPWAWNAIFERHAAVHRNRQARGYYRDAAERRVEALFKKFGK